MMRHNACEGLVRFSVMKCAANLQGKSRRRLSIRGKDEVWNSLFGTMVLSLVIINVVIVRSCDSNCMKGDGPTKGNVSTRIYFATWKRGNRESRPCSKNWHAENEYGACCMQCLNEHGSKSPLCSLAHFKLCFSSLELANVWLWLTKQRRPSHTK